MITLNMTVKNSDPCSTIKASRQIAVVWEELLQLQVDSVAPTSLCFSDQSTFNLSVEGVGFMQIVTITTTGTKKSKKVVTPTVKYNGMTFNTTIIESSCQNMTAASAVITQVCTKLHVRNFRGNATGTSNTLTVVNPTPCFTTASLSNALLYNASC